MKKPKKAEPLTDEQIADLDRRFAAALAEGWEAHKKAQQRTAPAQSSAEGKNNDH